MGSVCPAYLNMTRDGVSFYGWCILATGHEGHHRSIYIPLGHTVDDRAWIEWRTSDG